MTKLKIPMHNYPNGLVRPRGEVEKFRSMEVRAGG